MDTTQSSSNTTAIVAIDGLHASLIYLGETHPSTTRTELQSPVRWRSILDLRIEIEKHWESLISLTQKQDLPGLGIILESFPTSAHLYEAAIFTFRNISIGLKPDSLENIFAIFSLSYVASICSQRMSKPEIDNIFHDINIWRDSIAFPQHRQLFNDLIQRLRMGMTTSLFQTEHFLYSVSPFNGQYYMGPQGVTMHDISLFGDFSDPFWGDHFDVPRSPPGPNFQVAGPEGISRTVPDTPELQLPSGEDLRQSAVMNILTSFIANCGDLMDILSGHGVTTKGPHSDVSLEVKNFTQALRRHDSFGDPSARGILAIVDRFVDLNYFQSIDEIRDYIIIVGKEMLHSGQTFAKVCKAVYSSTEMTKTPQVVRRQHARRPLDRKLKKIPCDQCGEEFTRKTNMRRHIARKHANHSASDAPMVSVRTG
ncbi:uncharacterized protein FMAN_03532 [Fusarium mangiferae]|uniref:C2H2-type domain-containing protein n=1 Tax=Fusarium mangiferae TaxID=192010 RepID=A0A1L7T6S9_FUSMA|nr:uncharacterized protein FMAN_03532 [Fusarium mangiferae]CVK94420.1 uncharacterized protein FMAN_03532 [Fusarium mangiferae]